MKDRGFTALIALGSSCIFGLAAGWSVSCIAAPAAIPGIATPATPQRSTAGQAASPTKTPAATVPIPPIATQQGAATVTPLTVPTVTGAVAPPLPTSVITGEPAGPTMKLSLDQVITRVTYLNPSVQLAQERLNKAIDSIGTVEYQRKPQVSVEAGDSQTTYKAFAPSEIQVTPVNLQSGVIPVVTDTAQSGLFTGSAGIGSSNGLSAGGTQSGTGSATTTSSPLTIVPVTSAPGSTTTTTATPSSSGSGSSGTSGNAPIGGGAVSPQVKTLAQSHATDLPNATSGGGSGTSSTSGGQYNTYGATLSATQLLDVFGLLGQSVKVAQENAEFYRLDLERTLNELTLTTKNVFFAVLQAQANVATSVEQVANAQAIVKDTQLRFNAGTVAHFDVISAESQLQNSEQALIAARNDLTVQLESLNNLMHQPLDTNLELVQPDLPALPATYDATTEVNHAYAARPEVEQANLNEDIATRIVRLQQGGNKPTIAVGVTSDYSSVSTESGGQAITGALTAEVSWPLYDGGLTRARVKTASDDLKTQIVTLDQLHQNVDLEVRSALAVLVDSAALVNADRLGVTLARESLRLARVQYDAGTGTLLEVTNAQASLATVEYNESAAEFQLQTAYASLQRAEGAR